jgi:UDP-perosamine 4-acetyltransferase
MKKKIVLIGGGGHCKVVIDTIRKAKTYEITGIVDSSLKAGSDVAGIKVLGNDDILPQLYDQGIKYAFISVGSIGDCGIRVKLYESLKKTGFELPAIAHPAAVIADDVELGEGTFIAAGVVINPGTKIGKNAIINTSSSIDHDCGIGDFVHIAPGVTLSGGVNIGSRTHIGTGASIVQYKNIGRNQFIKAGNVVSEDLPDRQAVSI